MQIQYRTVLFASNERSCLSQDLCCSITWHPSRLVQCTRPSSIPSISTEIQQTLKELHDDDFCGNEFPSFLHPLKARKHQELSYCQLVACVVWDLFKGRKKSRKYGTSTWASFFLTFCFCFSSFKHKIHCINVQHELQSTSSWLCALPRDVGEVLKLCYYVSGIHHVIILTTPSQCYWLGWAWAWLHVYVRYMWP